MSRKRILVVDDEEAIRSVLADLFEGLGYQVCQQDNGKAGLQSALSEELDLVILDLSLPGCEGW